MLAIQMLRACYSNTINSIRVQVFVGDLWTNTYTPHMITHNNVKERFFFFFRLYDRIYEEETATVVQANVQLAIGHKKKERVDFFFLLVRPLKRANAIKPPHFLFSSFPPFSSFIVDTRNRRVRAVVICSYQFFFSSSINLSYFQIYILVKTPSDMVIRKF